ncbi:MAG: hypothetical protein MN733_18720 [Nitrososphaera sp.]|nr:hypothetical protein [Nitrososphaera sp.]
MSEYNTAHLVRNALSIYGKNTIISVDGLARDIMRPRAAIGAELARLCSRNFLKRIGEGKYEIVHSIVPPIKPPIALRKNAKTLEPLLYKEVSAAEKPKVDWDLVLLRDKLLECAELAETLANKEKSSIDRAELEAWLKSK